MAGSIRQFVLCFIALGALVAAAQGDDLASLVSPQSGVLVLNSGQVLEGKISRAGDHYYLMLSSGEITVRAADVALHCRNLDEAYARRCESLRPEHVTERLKLAEWCLQNQLTAAAAREVAEAARYSPADPRITELRRRIVLASQQAHEPEPSSEPTHAATLEELDRIVRDLPPGVAATFTSSIQPMLMNQCGTAACHGPQRSNELSLQRVGNGRSPSRRLTLRNLGNALERIDRDDPDASPLLTRPLGGDEAQPHPPVFADRESDSYRALAAWVREVAGIDDVESQPAAGPPDAPLLQMSSPPGRTAAASRGDASDPAGSTPKPANNSSTERRLERIGLGYDPLDPEMFNRRHFPNRKSPPAADSPPATDELPDAPQ